MQHGFSLLEVLVTLFLISMGLFGFAEAELNAMRELKLLQQYAFLTQQLTSLDEQLQITSQKAMVIHDWAQNIKVLFPTAEIFFTTNSKGRVVKIQWRDHQQNYHLEETLYD